jgi:hypothetical protein
MKMPKFNKIEWALMAFTLVTVGEGIRAFGFPDDGYTPPETIARDASRLVFGRPDGFERPSDKPNPLDQLMSSKPN